MPFYGKVYQGRKQEKRIGMRHGPFVGNIKKPVGAKSYD